MRYFQFLLSMITSVSVFSYDAYAMEHPDDAQRSRVTYVTISRETPPEEVIDRLTGPNPPQAVVLEKVGCAPQEYVGYSPQEYYTFCGANDTKSTLGRKYKKELDTLLKNNCIKKNGYYHLKPNFQYSHDFAKQLYKLCEIFYENTELLSMYARVNKDINPIASLHYFAEAIKGEGYKTGNLRACDADEYLSLLVNMKISSNPNVDFGEKLPLLINNPKKYLDQQKITQKPQRAIKKALLECCELLFNNIQQYQVIDPPLHIEAICLYLKGFIIDFPEKYYNNDFSLVRDLGAHLYTKVSAFGTSDIFPSLRLEYAEYLLMEGEYSKASELYKSVLEGFGGSKFFLQSQYYRNWGLCYLLDKDYENARRVIKMELDLIEERSFPRLTQWNLAFANMMCGTSDDSTLKTLAGLSPADHKKHLFMSSKTVDLAYQYALKKANCNEELAEYLLSKQAKALEKVLTKKKQQGQRVKAGVEAQRQLSQAITSPATEPQKSVRPQKTIIIGQSNPYDDPMHPSSTQKEKHVASEVKEKVKTHGTPNPQMAETPTKTLVSPRKPLIYAETLLSGNPLKIFHKLFSKYDNNIKTDTNVQISLHEMDTLFSAFKEIGASAGLDKKAGKGAHQKGTLDFQKFGSNIEKHVMILTDSTYLKPYQIKKHRDDFIHIGVVPQDPDIIDKIEEEFPDEF